MKFFSTLIALTVLAGRHAVAYNDNCDGSGAAGIALIPADCNDARDSVDTMKEYKDGTEFSKGTCYVKYATNGSGDQAVSGQDIVNAMNDIQEQCDPPIGSRGTGNCDECHVTINYRAA
ncbi:hypothetical protein PHISCL_07880 [Aspergillus sclerotialis]|uniref:Uncharacterized protein n=1 Tax=Aspergillus sclerotialis TaxID=2070753 RepID=A0A3A2Z9K7_9EURO|nr:hypothetical protein PHISCL_07880 [Aspergillus sclerotialis]